MEKKKKVLWASRHRPIPAERKELKRILGDYELYHFTGRVEVREDNGECSHFIEYIKDLKPDIIVPVLPLTVVKYLVEKREKYGYEVWEATFEEVGVSDTPIHDEDNEVAVMLLSGKWKIMRFVGFSRIKDIKVEKELIR